MKQLTFKKGFNLVLNKLETRFACARLASRPVVVDVVITKACNLACTFCKDYEHPGAKRIEREKFAKVAAALFPAARWVNICSGGEPYLHKGLEDLLEHAKRHKTKRWVLSNGMLLEEERMRRIVADDLITLHGFSIDGIEPATVETIRVNAKLPVILNNVKMLLRLKDELKKSEPGIVIRYALMRRNIEELPLAVRYWGELGVDRLDTGYLSIANGIEHEESLWFHQELTARVFDEAREVAERYPGLTLRLPPTVEQEKPKLEAPQRCTAPWDFVMIDTSGNVLPCYRAFEALSMGNLYIEEARPFAETWNSPDYQALRRTVNDDSRDKHYAYCKVCENRYGWGSLDAHLGDETWSKVVFDNRDDAAAVDHRRPGFRTLEESAKRVSTRR